MVFLFEFAYVVDYVDGFPYSEPSLHPWDEANLISVNDHFVVLLDVNNKNLIEYFCINFHKGNWSEVLFLCCVFLIFLYLYNCVFIDQIG